MAKKDKYDVTILTKFDMKQWKNKLLYSIILLFMIAYVCICVIPVVWIMLSGFKDANEMYAVPPSLFPKSIDLSKLATAWTSMKIYKYYLNTLVMALGATFFNLVICGLAGYSFSKLKPAGSKVLFMIFFWVMLLPSTASTVPLYMTIRDFPIFHFNMTDSYLPIWLMQGSNVFGILLFKNFFDTISVSIYEAAKVDGAGTLRIFSQIILPLSVPIITVSSLFCFNAQLGQFFWPYLLISNKDLTVLGVHLFKLKSSTFSMDLQMLALVFAILPPLIIYAIFQKQIVGGINLGGVKG